MAQIPTSMHAEAMGHLAAVVAIKVVKDSAAISFPPDTPLVVPGFIDNKAVIARKQNHCEKGFQECTRDEWEILHESQCICSSLNVDITLQHVKSHQDAEKPYEELSMDAQLNVDADQLATTAHSRPLHSEYIVLPDEKVLLKLHGRPLTHHLRQALWEAAASSALPKHIIKQANWSDPNTFDKID
jgi:hypothetical protein